MRAVEAKTILNDAGYACAWSGDVTDAGKFNRKQPSRLLVTKNGKILDIISVVRGKVDDHRVSEAANSEEAMLKHAEAKA